jgi:hypothetical protein
VKQRPYSVGKRPHCWHRQPCTTLCSPNDSTFLHISVQFLIPLYYYVLYTVAVSSLLTTINTQLSIKQADCTLMTASQVSFRLSNIRLQMNFLSDNVKDKGKVLPLQAKMASMVGRGIAVPFLDRGIRRGVSGQQHAPAALYPRERHGTNCTGGWVGPRAGVDRCGKYHPTRIRFPDRSARSQSLY